VTNESRLEGICTIRNIAHPKVRGAASDTNKPLKSTNSAAGAVNIVLIRAYRRSLIA
jgi:hypothetical protein